MSGSVHEERCRGLSVQWAGMRAGVVLSDRAASAQLRRRHLEGQPSRLQEAGLRAGLSS